MKKETDFKNNLYNEIRDRFPGTEVVINDSGYIQGFPDATVYFPNGRYFLLEGKRVLEVCYLLKLVKAHNYFNAFLLCNFLW